VLSSSVGISFFNKPEKFVLIPSVNTRGVLSKNFEGTKDVFAKTSGWIGAICVELSSCHRR
jgi:hypothetical protein